MNLSRAELKKWLLASAPARARGDFVFLQDPFATDQDREKVDALWASAERNARRGEGAAAAAGLPAAEELDAERGWICIPTGGSSGRTRFARHDEETIAAAVSGFCLHYGVSRVNAVSVLPLHHVSGLMARLRCLATGGTYVPWDWRNLAAGDWPALTMSHENESWMISLVPTQLQRLLDVPGGADFLRRFRFIFIGGAAAWPELLERAAAEKLPLNLSYGMTETAAMVAAQWEGAFLRGERDSGRVMPHARVSVTREDGVTCATGEVGHVRIVAKSLFRGYFPNTRSEPDFAPEDLGCLDGQGRLTILGRRDGMIVSGAEKVWPAEVEAALRSTGQFSDIVVLGMPDPRWGEAVTAFYPAADGLRELEVVCRELEGKLSAFKFPKRLVPVLEWPRNAQGKVNRALLKMRAADA
jgi:O-succinylbenzoic acid--CoA ligase